MGYGATTCALRIIIARTTLAYGSNSQPTPLAITNITTLTT